jgi:tRNA/rRNA methyltransferase
LQDNTPYKVFHSTCEFPREKVHVILVRPEYGGNVGSTARAIANMGVCGSLRIVGNRQILNAEAWRMAKHAKNRLDDALFFDSLKAAIPEGKPLLLAATARAGSANRPHPLPVHTAVERAIGKVQTGEVSDIVFVFGPEADGLSNEDIEACDWVVKIDSSEEYRSLNLSQAVLIFSYELNRQLTQDWAERKSDGRSQRDRLISHFVGMAEAVGFVLPGDPFKMRPRLEEILSQLPPYFKDVNTLHGLLEQVIRSVKAGEPEYKGRYRHKVESQ